MFSRFFIDHPVFANVIAIITVLLGAVALWALPIEQYPQITPPTVQVRTTYPGANAEVVANTVAAPIEQQVNGVERMLYMSSTGSSDGSYTLTVTFEIGTDLDIAQVLVQNRVAMAEPLLPEEVRRQGVTVKKQSTDIILLISLTSPRGTYDSTFLANYATLRLRDELSRVKGVGDVRIFGGSDYSMRVWLDPELLQARDLTTQDVIAALQGQNVQVAAGQVGAPPTPAGQQFQFTLTALGRLSDPRQFGRIVVKADGPRVVFLDDVARVELGSQTYDSFATATGRESAGLLIYQLPGANALGVAQSVHAMIEQLGRDFPPDLEYTVPFDTTLFVRAGVSEVYRTLFEAGVLVLVVILLFLQSWRAVLVPATTVPVTIIGAFACMWTLGFSVNFLTLFGLVLAIGIVVDDAIVIVENAAHHIERGESPHDATVRAMGEVTGPIISITLVLMAVFLPASFLGGVTGQLYRQFALTIAATALISAINALTLKPAQCASWLRPARHGDARPGRWWTRPLDWFVAGFNATYARTERGYTWLVHRLLTRPVLVLASFAGLMALTAWWYLSLPTGFLPTEDQGYAIISLQLPDAASQQRTRAVTQQLDKILANEPGLVHWNTLGGLSLLDGTNASNAATVFIIFKPWDERGKDQSQDAILDRLRREFAQIQEAIVFPFVPPAIRGLGVAGGFQLQVEDRTGVGLIELDRYVQILLQRFRKEPAIGPATTTFRPGVPQLFVDVDRVKVKTLGLNLTDVFNTLQAFLGSAYVNDFNLFGRTYQVRVQAGGQFRNEIEDVRRLKVRNRDGQMVPLSTLLTVEKSFGPQVITRYNLYPSASIQGAAAPGVSSGEALDAVERVARDSLPASLGFDWTGIAYQERLVGGQAVYVFFLAVLLVYLVLCAQYESWMLPLAVILVVPLGILGATAGVWLRGIDNNVYTQVGVVLIIALASKNAILIVEFARELRLAGRSVVEAAAEAARLRFRPILMTSFAFILGVVPLVFAEGAGAVSRRSLGAAVFGGMISSTVLAVLFVPIFYRAIQGLIEWASGPPKQPDA